MSIFRSRCRSTFPQITTTYTATEGGVYAKCTKGRARKNMIFPVISWKGSSIVDGSGEPDEYIYSYEGLIQSITESDKRITLGKFRAY